MNILAAFAEFESARIGERVKDVRRQLLNQGRWPSGRTLYGYRWNKAEKRFEVVEEEAAIVRYVFHLYVHENIGQTQVAERLYNEGYRTRKGHTWWARSVNDILKDRRYIGEDNHFTYPPIISNEIFEMATRKRTDEYDGSLMGRLRFALEVIDRIRAKCHLLASSFSKVNRNDAIASASLARRIHPNYFH